MEIQGYPKYLIYEDGRVFSKYKNKFIKPHINSEGYYHKNLYENNNRKNHSIHRLVAIHYIPNPDMKPQVDHINRIKTDNRICNLRWVTGSENMQNQGIRIDNTSGVKYISYNTRTDYWVFRKIINGKLTCKTFKTKEEAIEFKNQFDLTCAPAVPSAIIA